MQEIHRILAKSSGEFVESAAKHPQLLPTCPHSPTSQPPHLLQAKAAKEKADAAAAEKESAEKAAAEAIVYIKCPHCRHLCYIFWRMSGWALISVCCWNQDRLHWQILDDTMDGINME